jgi:hypothetical protein
MEIGEAVDALKCGERVARKWWRGQYLLYYSPLANGNEWFFVHDDKGDETKKLKPFIMMKTVDNEWIPWSVSIDDILADDYEIV